MAVSFVATLYGSLKVFDELSRSLVRTDDLAPLRADTAAMGSRLDAKLDKLDAKLDRLADGQSSLACQAARLEARLDARLIEVVVVVVVVAAGLAIWLGRKPGAGRGAE